jgi:hypothetical protein
MLQYIPDADKLMPFLANMVSCHEEGIQAAMKRLSHSPVVGYEPFTEQEVRLIAAYRATLTLGGYDFVWPGIVAGGWEAWIYAIHEAVELEVFATLNVNPFDFDEWKRNWSEPHRVAVLYELRFLQDWAMQSGFKTTEIAIETENPIRGILVHEHRNFIGSLREHTAWLPPSFEELQTARQFWQFIRQEGNTGR